jgi:hypothetical protein
MSRLFLVTGSGGPINFVPLLVFSIGFIDAAVRAVCFSRLDRGVL